MARTKNSTDLNSREKDIIKFIEKEIEEKRSIW